MILLFQYIVFLTHFPDFEPSKKDELELLVTLFKRIILQKLIVCFCRQTKSLFVNSLVQKRQYVIHNTQCNADNHNNWCQTLRQLRHYITKYNRSQGEWKKEWLFYNLIICTLSHSPCQPLPLSINIAASLLPSHPQASPYQTPGDFCSGNVFAHFKTHLSTYITWQLP